MNDLISRQAAIDALENGDRVDALNPMSMFETMERQKAITLICMVPSAQPERKTGRWIEDSGNIACSICHTIWLHRRTSYCPNCGAEMKAEP